MINCNNNSACRHTKLCFISVLEKYHIKNRSKEIWQCVPFCILHTNKEFKELHLFTSKTILCEYSRLWCEQWIEPKSLWDISGWMAWNQLSFQNAMHNHTLPGLDSHVHIRAMWIIEIRSPLKFYYFNGIEWMSIRISLRRQTHRTFTHFHWCN